MTCIVELMLSLTISSCYHLSVCTPICYESEVLPLHGLEDKIIVEEQNRRRNNHLPITHFEFPFHIYFKNIDRNRKTLRNLKETKELLILKQEYFGTIAFVLNATVNVKITFRCTYLSLSIMQNEKGKLAAIFSNSS